MKVLTNWDHIRVILGFRLRGLSWDNREESGHYYIM